MPRPLAGAVGGQDPFDGEPCSSGTNKDHAAHADGLLHRGLDGADGHTHRRRDQARPSGAVSWPCGWAKTGVGRGPGRYPPRGRTTRPFFGSLRDRYVGGPALAAPAGQVFDVAICPLLRHQACWSTWRLPRRPSRSSDPVAALSDPQHDARRAGERHLDDDLLDPPPAESLHRVHEGKREAVGWRRRAFPDPLRERSAAPRSRVHGRRTRSHARARDAPTRSAALPSPRESRNPAHRVRRGSGGHRSSTVGARSARDL